MSFLRPASWIRPLGHHIWKRKTFLLSIAIVILFVLIFAQFSDVNSPSRPLPLPFSFNRYISSKSRPQPASRVQNHDVYFGAAQSGAVLPKPLPVNNGLLSGVESDSPIILPSGEPSDPETKKRRDFIRDMMLFAWNGYVNYAWGENELKPISKKPHLQGIFGRGKIGATITDSLDTLYIMGLTDEFNKGKEWIKNELSLNDFQGDLSVFETTIRVVGGLLTCYAFTKDRMFIDKAKEVADVLLPAFNSETGIPFSLINPRTKVPKNYQWASASSYSILSEIGTMHLEFVYLSELVGDPVYKEKVLKVREILHKAVKPKGLYPNYINPRTGKWGQHHISMGALGDSYYEYLLKAWLQSGGEDTQAREMYDEAIAAVEKHLLRKSKGGLYYFADMKYERLEHKMGHLACFAGGLLSLGAQALEGEAKEHPMNIAAELTHTCHESYARTKTKLGPESFRFSDGVEAEATQLGEKYYILRPETIESYFYLWRFTKDKKYREWAWEAAQALEKHCKVEAGYSGIHNVYDENSQKDDVQQSFLTAETLKYLYLIFSEDDLLPFDQWVFNTEAHPLPIRGRNPIYLAPNSSIVKEESNKSVGDPDTVDEEEMKKE